MQRLALSSILTLPKEVQTMTKNTVRAFVLAFLTARCAALAAVFASSAAVAGVYSTSFENPPFSATAGAGSLGYLKGQDGWGAGTAAPGTGPFRIDNTVGRARTGTQCVSIDTGNQFFNSGRKLNGIAFNQSVADLAVQPIVTISTWVNLFGPGSISGSGILGEAGIESEGTLSTAVNPSRIARMSIESSGKILLTNQSNTTITRTLAGFATSTWYCLEMRIDYGAKKVGFFVNGTAVDTSSTAGFDSFTHVKFDNAYLLAGKNQPPVGVGNGSWTLLYDDFSVSTVPVPSAAALLGAAGLLGRRRA